MFVEVKLLNGFEKKLLYKVPEKKIAQCTLGCIVKVPLKQYTYAALVTKIVHNLSDKTKFIIKEIIKVENLPHDTTFRSFIERIASYTFTPEVTFYQRLQSYLKASSVITEKIPKQDIVNTLPTLTNEQKSVVEYVIPSIKKSNFLVTLLQGVTGSGKTEVYKHLILTCLKAGKTALLLLPEVSLSLQFEYLLKQQLPEFDIIGFHSASKISDKKSVWRKLCNNKPLLIIGVHQPVLLPIKNIGLIIVDEEHEVGYQEKKHPKVNSKELALLRAQTYNIPILLGSATPSTTTLANVTKKNWSLFKLKKRFSGKFPTIQKILLTTQRKKRRKSFWISHELEIAIQETLERKEQVIIYLNRRGYSFFIFCKKCGFIFKCPHCSVSLTPHNHSIEERLILQCHYCEFTQKKPNNCPECNNEKSNFAQKGLGTQQAVEILKKLLPQARIARADLDSTKKKKLWRETVQAFEQGDIDILVGTKTISKGYHFPNVTLVGIIWADLNLHIPTYNAQETALQQLIQVAGRTGRGNTKSTVIVQAIHDHPIFDYISEEQYTIFAEEELKLRKTFNYPPYIRLVSVEIRHKNEAIINEESLCLFNQLVKQIHIKKYQIKAMGPTMPIISKIKNTEIRTITLKVAYFNQAKELLNSINLTTFKSSIFIVINN